MGEIHSRLCCTRNGCAEVMFCLPGLIDAVGNAGVIQQHIEQDDAMRQLVQGGDGRDPALLQSRCKLVGLRRLSMGDIKRDENIDILGASAGSERHRR